MEKLLILSFALISLPVQGEEAARPPSPEQKKPAVERIDETRYRIGKVVFDQKTREIRFPAKVNMTEGLLEFLIVHENGKVHESLFSTDISPTHLNLAFTLLRYPPSKELYRIPREPGLLSNNFYEVPEETRNAARVSIHVEYLRDGETKIHPAHDWILHEPTRASMKPTHWIYGASEFFDGRYVPESTGDIAAIYITNSSILNYPGEGNLDDTIWSVHTNRVPDLDTNVTLIIAPLEDKAAEKP